MGDFVEIYSTSNQKWFNGKIVTIFTEDEIERLRVQFQIGANQYKEKDIGRYSQDIKPIIVTDISTSLVFCFHVVW